MADFCTNCARGMGFEVPDIDIRAIAEKLEPGYIESCLCEGCGIRGVGRYASGEIMVVNGLGNDVLWDESQETLQQPGEGAMVIDGQTLQRSPGFAVPGIVSKMSTYEASIRFPQVAPKTPVQGAIYEEAACYRVWTGSEWMIVPKSPVEQRARQALAVLLADERMTYPTANIQTNAPLALIQCSMAAEINRLESILGLPLSKFPLKKNAVPRPE